MVRPSNAASAGVHGNDLWRHLTLRAQVRFSAAIEITRRKHERDQPLSDLGGTSLN